MIVPIKTEQAERVNALVRSACANCQDGCCLLLDDGNSHPCVYQCTLAVRAAFSKLTQREIDDFIIDTVLREGTADISKSDLQIITATAQEYVEGIFRRLREHGYDDQTMRLYICGGGGCLVKHFYTGSLERVSFIDDICAAAKGYEALAEIKLKADESREK